MLKDCKLKWRVSGEFFTKEGQLPVPGLKQGELTQVGAATFVPLVSKAGYKLEMQVALHDDHKLVNENNWSFWAFPEPPELSTVGLLRLNTTNPPAIPAGTPLVIAGFADQALVDYVSAGGKCLLLSHGSNIENTNMYAGSTSFYTTFRTIPWNAGPGNSGTVIANHPALAAFPHDEMCDLQFAYLIRDALPMEFTPLKQYGVKPIVRGIDWYRTNRDNAYLVEFYVGQGKVLASTFNILPRMKGHLEARDFARGLADYALSDQFHPTANVPADKFMNLFSQRPEEPTTKGK